MDWSVTIPDNNGSASLLFSVLLHPHNRLPNSSLATFTSSVIKLSTQNTDANTNVLHASTSA